jgi:hypothetical protein
MNLDDLKTQWRIEVEEASPTHDLRFEGIQRGVSEFNRSVRLGNFWMIFGSVCGSALAVFFGWLTLDGVGSLAKLTIAANVIVTAWMIFMLLRARRVSRSDDWTLRSRLEIEIERLEKQRNLWSYGGIWLLAPMSVYVLLGLPARLYWVWFVLCALVYWTVRRGTRRTIDPSLSKLKGLHRELVDSE